MSQIFISHSRADQDGIDFINKAFASTKVEAKYEEIEAILHGQRSAADISRDIIQSNALFVLLGREIEELKHTRDWVAWESGVAAGAAFQANKDIWVFEPLEESPRLSVAIPHLRPPRLFRDERSVAGIRQIYCFFLRRLACSPNGACRSGYWRGVGQRSRRGSGRYCSAHPRGEQTIQAARVLGSMSKMSI